MAAEHNVDLSSIPGTGLAGRVTKNDMLSYIGGDQVFDLRVIVEDIIQRPFITVGMAAVILMTPLAISSTPNKTISMVDEPACVVHMTDNAA